MDAITDILTRVVSAEQAYFTGSISRKRLLGLMTQIRRRYQANAFGDPPRDGITPRMALLFVLRRVAQKIVLEDKLMEMVDSEVAFVSNSMKAITAEPIKAGHTDSQRTPYPDTSQKYSKPKTRANFPMDTSQLLRAWLKENMDNPYPSDAEKAYLCQKTGLGPAQINNWFINARRRILPFMKGKCGNFK